MKRGKTRKTKCERKGHKWGAPEMTAADNIHRYEICARCGKWQIREADHG